MLRKPYPPGSELECLLRFDRIGRPNFKPTHRAIILGADLYLPGYRLPVSTPDIQVIRVPLTPGPDAFYWPVPGIHCVTCMGGNTQSYARILTCELLAHKAASVTSFEYYDSEFLPRDYSQPPSNLKAEPLANRGKAA